MVNNNNTKNGGWDLMDVQADAGKGLLGLLGLTAVGGTAIKIANDRKKEALKKELEEVRCELSKKKSNIFKEAWYASEIAQLEEREKKLIQKINKL